MTRVTNSEIANNRYETWWPFAAVHGTDVAVATNALGRAADLAHGHEESEDRVRTQDRRRPPLPLARRNGVRMGPADGGLISSPARDVADEVLAGRDVRRRPSPAIRLSLTRGWGPTGASGQGAQALI